ncbi:MAG: GNAT family N-acetyltransferase [Anaerolineae bacterium]
MLTLTPEHITPALRDLFPSDQPAQLRFDGVLNGAFPGRLLTDDPDRPSWGVLQENVYGTIYLGGRFDADRLEEIVRLLRQDTAELLFGYWDAQHPLADLFPDPLYRGAVYDCTERAADTPLAFDLTVPAGLQLRPFDEELLRQSADYDFHISLYGSEAETLANGVGFALLNEHGIVSEAFAGLRVGNLIEVGVTTRPSHRGKGYATCVSAHLVLECERRGLQTYWNCNAQNTASLSIARTLGYQRQRIYNLYGWF